MSGLRESISSILYSYFGSLKSRVELYRTMVIMRRLIVKMLLKRAGYLHLVPRPCWRFLDRFGGPSPCGKGSGRNF